MPKLTKGEIAQRLADKAGLKREDFSRMLAALADLAAEELRQSGEFTIPGIGKLIKVNRLERTGRNPRTGQVIRIPGRSTVKFRIDTELASGAGLAGDPTKPGDPD